MPQIHQKLKIHQKYKTMTKYRISFSPHCLYIKCIKGILGLYGYNLSLKRDDQLRKLYEQKPHFVLCRYRSLQNEQ